MYVIHCIIAILLSVVGKQNVIYLCVTCSSKFTKYSSLHKNIHNKDNFPAAWIATVKTSEEKNNSLVNSKESVVNSLIHQTIELAHFKFRQHNLRKVRSISKKNSYPKRNYEQLIKKEE